MQPQGEDPRRWIGVVHRALVAESLIPSPSLLIGEAALRASRRLGTQLVGPLPAWFGRDLEREVAYLSALLPAGGPWWEVCQAMAWDSGVPHTAVVSADFGAAMGALTRGEPLSSPGFFLWKLPDGRMVVVDVDERGSGHASGLRPGDVMLSVDGRPVGRPNSEVLPFYTAAPGSRFAVDLERAGEALSLVLELEQVEVPSVVQRRLEGGVGEVSVRWFASSDGPSRDTATQVRAALEQMRSERAPGLIIDLRSGVGGMVDAAIGIASALCDAEVVFSHLVDDGGVRDLHRSGDPVWSERPLAVLVNEQTISAAECLALALSELAGATLIGEPTAGGLNGIRSTALSDGYQLLLPHGVVVGPSSRRPRPGHRLEPDIHVAKPTPEALAAGVDPARETARRWVLGAR